MSRHRAKLVSFIFALVAASEILSGDSAIAVVSSQSIWQFEVTVQPGPRYNLAAPADGRVVKVPLYGEVYKPPKPWTLVFSPLDDDEGKTPVVFDLHKGVYEQLNAKFNNYQAMDQLLQDYGQRGASSPISNLPWDGEQDTVIRAAVMAASDLTTDDTGDLKSYRDELVEQPVDTPLSGGLKDLADSINSDAHLERPLSNSEWRDVLRRAVVYKIRQQNQLNSSDYYVSFNGSDVFDTEPNNPAFDRANTRSFLIGRPSLATDTRTEGAAALTRYQSYWQKVHDENLQNQSDVDYLKSISFLQYKNEKQPNEVLDILLADCVAAQKSMSNWVVIYQAIRTYVAAAHTTNTQAQQQAFGTFDTQLRSLSLNLSESDVKATEAATDRTRALGMPSVASETPWATVGAVSLVADQARPPLRFRGQIISVAEQDSVVDASMNFNFWSPPMFPTPFQHVFLPVNPGSALWEKLTRYKGRYFGGEIGETNPFVGSLMQALNSLYPTFASPWPSGYVNIDRAAELVRLAHTFRNEMMQGFSNSAIPFRQYAVDLLNQYIRDTKSLRGGHFEVPETSAVDAVSVEAGQWVPAGTTLAIFRPISQFNLTITSKNSSLDRFLLKGSSLDFQLSCNDPIPATKHQKDLILQMPQRNQLSKLLGSIESRYLSSERFRGTVEDEDANESSSAIPGTRRLHVSVKVPTSEQVVHLTVDDFAPMSFSSGLSALKAAGFDVKTTKNSDGAVMQLDAGVIELGSSCVMTVIPPASLSAAVDEQRKWSALTAAH